MLHMQAPLEWLEYTTLCHNGILTTVFAICFETVWRAGDIIITMNQHDTKWTRSCLVAVRLISVHACQVIGEMLKRTAAGVSIQWHYFQVLSWHHCFRLQDIYGPETRFNNKQRVSLKVLIHCRRYWTIHIVSVSTVDHKNKCKWQLPHITTKSIN